MFGDNKPCITGPNLAKEKEESGETKIIHI